MLQETEISKRKINKIEKTSDTLTGRGGLALFVRYLSGIGLYPHLKRLFGSIRKSQKGVPVCNIFKQLLCFFVDGTSLHIARFDELAKDPGYAEVIENNLDSMCSSHSIMRFYKAFSYVMIWLFRRLLQELFIWRLKISQPDIIILGIDTMGMNNNDADKREGVSPTYKKYKGFQPLQLTWGRYMIDAVFRGGSKHSNHGDTVVKMIGYIVNKIRKRYRSDVPIALCSDGGFFDQDNFKCFEKIKIGYSCSGKLYSDIKDYVSSIPQDSFSRYDNKRNSWDYLEFGDMRGTWDKFRRAIYLKPVYEDSQMLLEFARPQSVIYTNLGVDSELTELFVRAGKEEYFEVATIIKTHHNRGNDELDNRALKDFGTEKMPFKRFTPNAAYYYTMLVAFFLYESFKEDVAEPIFKVSIYPTTFRRILIDFAAKIVHTGGEIILKVTETVWEAINIPELWQRCNDPPVIHLGLL